MYRNPKLKQLQQELPFTLLNSRANNTLKKYNYGFNKWKQWANKYEEINYFPARAMDVALFMQEQINTGESFGAIETVYYGINHAHSICGENSPTSSKLVQNILEFAKRNVNRSQKKKDHIPLDLMKRISEVYGKSKDLIDLRFITMTAIAFHGFMRIGEVLNLCRKDIEITNSKMQITANKSKTDQYGRGSKILIARYNKDWCPVRHMERYLSITGMESKDKGHLFLFRRIRATKKTKNLTSLNVKLSYARTREIYREKLNLIGEDPNKYGLHSLRSGGATAAAQKGISAALIKKQGRWKSDVARDIYIRSSRDEMIRF